MCEREGVIGVCVWFWAPIMHKMSCFKFGMTSTLCLRACAFKIDIVVLKNRVA